MNVLVVAFSGLDAANYRGRREMCRKTWFPGLQALGYNPRFIFSKPKTPEGTPTDFGDDCVILDGITESWDNLPQKSAATFRWALQQRDWKYIFKCDDDSLIIPQRFHEFMTGLRDTRYLGGDVGTCQGKPPYASGGAGYLLRADAVHVALAELEKHPVGCEDVIVGNAMRNAGIPFTADPRFSPWPPKGVPAKENDLISGHALTANLWWEAWTSCTGEDCK